MIKMPRPSPAFVAILGGLLVTFLALLFQPLFLPGIIVALPFWPQGIHTRPGLVSNLLFLLTVYVGTWAFWAAVLYFPLRRLLRPSPGQTQS